MNHINELSIKIKPVKSIFNRLTLKEPVNIQTLNKLINSDLLVSSCHGPNAKIYESERELLIKYSELVKDGYAYIHYTKQMNKPGRCSAQRGLSYLGIRREIRHTLANDTMVDIDIDNCHPVLMVQMLKAYGYNCVHLKDYIANREQWFINTRLHCGIDREFIINRLKEKQEKSDEEVITEEQIKGGLKDIVKTLFLRLMYHGKYESWARDNGLDVNKKPSVQVMNFINELKEIGAIFVNQNPKIVDVITKRNKQKGKTDKEGNALNVVGGVCSVVMQDKENKVLEHIFDYLRLAGVIKNNVASLCADGIMISRDYYRPRVLTEITGYVFSMTGFMVNMSCKAMDQGYKDLDLHVIGKPYESLHDNTVIIDTVQNMGEDSYLKYVRSEFYNATFEITERKDKVIKMKSEAYFKCSVCNCEHTEGGNRVLTESDCGNVFIKCHTVKRLVFKSIKGKELERQKHVAQMHKRIKDYLTLDTEDVTVIEEDSKFLSCDENDVFTWRPEYSSKFLVLNTHMGKGKTSFISHFFDKLNKKSSILFVSQRKTFTNFICADFKKYDIINYQDITDGDYNKERLCIQIESLHKVTRDYDIVVMDECETILNNFSSSTMSKVKDCWEKLVSCVKLSSHCILADAFILQRTLDFIKGLVGNQEKVVMVHNTRPYLENRKAIQISQDVFDDHLINSLNNNKRVVNISSSRTDLLAIHKRLLEDCKDKNIKIYDKDSNKDDLRDVNGIWSQCDFIGYTPVIQTGVSYMSNPFDICYAKLKSTNLVRDAMQMLMRCRVLEDNTMYYALNKRQIFNTQNFNMFDTFEEFMDNRVFKTAILIKDLQQDNNSNFLTLVSTLLHSLTHDDPLLLKMIWYNLKEQMLSHCHYNTMCEEMLKLQGYTVISLNSSDNIEEDKKKADSKGPDEYNNIPSMSSDEVAELKYKDTTVLQRDSIDKYYFEHLLVQDLNINDKAMLFYQYFQRSKQKEKLYNVRYEKTHLSNLPDLVLDDHKKADELISKMKLKNCKLKHVRNLNNILGLDNSCSVNTVINQSVLHSKLVPYVRDNIKELQCIFNSKASIGKGNDSFNSLALVKKIFREWSGLEFKKHEGNRKVTKSYITEGFDLYDCIKTIDEKKAFDTEIFYNCDD